MSDDWMGGDSKHDEENNFLSQSLPASVIAAGPSSPPAAACLAAHSAAAVASPPKSPKESKEDKGDKGTTHFLKNLL